MQNEKKTRYIINQCFKNISIYGSTMNVEKTYHALKQDKLMYEMKSWSII